MSKPTLTILQIETRKFSFLVAETSLEAAQNRFRDAWAEHCRQFPADPDYGEILLDEATCLEVQPGDVFRDREPLRVPRRIHGARSGVADLGELAIGTELLVQDGWGSGDGCIEPGEVVIVTGLEDAPKSVRVRLAGDEESEEFHVVPSRLLRLNGLKYRFEDFSTRDLSDLCRTSLLEGELWRPCVLAQSYTPASKIKYHVRSPQADLPDFPAITPPTDSGYFWHDLEDGSPTYYGPFVSQRMALMHAIELSEPDPDLVDLPLRAPCAPAPKP